MLGMVHHGKQGRFSPGAAVQPGSDLSGDDLRRTARRSEDADQARRLPALAVIPDGGSGSEAARTGGVGLPVIRDRVLRLNAGGAEALVTRKAPGKTPVLTDEQRTALAATAGAGPRPDIDGIVRWRPVGPAQWAPWGTGRPGQSSDAGTGTSRHGVGRALRPPAALRTGRRGHRGVRKNVCDAVGDIRTRCGGKPTGIRFQDEARTGQKNQLTRRRARRGTRPRAPHDQRTERAYPFGAICPAGGKDAGLVMPCCDTHAMAGHPGPVSQQADAGAHAILIPDQAGSHASTELAVPDNITPVPMPPGSPELNPVGNVRQFIRDNRLSNIVFRNRDDIADHCCQAWNSLMDQTGRIMSIGCREWAQRL